MNDSAIIESLSARDERAIDEAKTKYGSFCRGIARNILEDAEEADECVNDMLFSLWSSIPPDKPESLKAYMACVTRRRALNMLRERSAKKRLGGGSPVSLEELKDCIPSNDTVEDEIGRRELTGLLNRWIGSLDKDDRILFMRRYWYGDPVSELSESFGTSAKRISHRLLGLRRRLRTFLEKEGIRI